MKPRFSLSWKIALLAVVNVLMVTVVLLIFAGVQFSISPESFIVAPSIERILSTARQFALDLAETPTASRKELIDRFSKEYGVEFHLVDSQGRTLTGGADTLPPEVINELRQRFPGPPGGGSNSGSGGPPPGRALGLGPRGGRGAIIIRSTTQRPFKYWVGVRMGIRSADNPDVTSGMLVLMSDSFMGNEFFFDPKPWIALTVAVIVVSVVVWLPMMRGLTHAISEMTRATSQIAEGQFETRVPVKRNDEVGLLVSSINSMSAQLAGFVKGQKRFLADIAHELCAPIARMQMALGILEQRADDTVREYVGDVKDEAEHMSELINELMSFSKAGMQVGETQIAPVPVADVVRRVLERESDTNTRIECSVSSDVRVLANPDSLFRALSNLVRNAIRYAGNAGPISISAHSEGPDTLITVADSGPGLPENELEQVFAPFYRIERSRGRDSGGTGLGLAIVKAGIEASKGTVRARNRHPSGLEVEIRLRTAPATV